MSHKPYELLVFDWDGTLMDSEARIVTCLEKAVTDIGAEARARHQLSDVIGLGLQEAVYKLYPDSDAAFIETFAAAYREHFLGDGVIPSELFAGAREVLTELSEAGYLLGVATGKSRRGLDRVLDETGLGRLFHATRCADESFSKPHPQMIEEIMTDLDTEPRHTLMIGDTEYDIMMAHNAGAAALAVSYGVHEIGRLLEHNPVGYIDQLDALPGWLRNEAAGSVA